MTREANRAKWQDIINEQMASDQTQAHWCAENDVNIHNFRYWKTRLEKASKYPQNSEISFVSLAPTSKQSKPMTIRIGTACIEVNEAVNLSLLEDVVKVLMHYA